MTKRALRSLGVAAALLVAASSARAAQPARSRQAPGPLPAAGAGCDDAPVRVVASVLELRPDQLSAWGTILGARDEALRPLAEQIQQHQQAIAAQFGSGSPDPGLVGHLFIEVQVLESQVRAVQQEAVARFRQILSPSQNQKLEHVRLAARLSPIVPAFAAAGLVAGDAAAREP